MKTHTCLMTTAELFTFDSLCIVRHMKARVGDAESVRSESEKAPQVGEGRAVETQLHRFGAARWPCPEREWGHHGEAGGLGGGCEHPGRS